MAIVIKRDCGLTRTEEMLTVAEINLFEIERLTEKSAFLFCS